LKYVEKFEMSTKAIATYIPLHLTFILGIHL